MDTTDLERKITSKTKAIIPVHLYGQSADMEPIMAIAHKYNLAVATHGAGPFHVAPDAEIVQMALKATELKKAETVHGLSIV